MIACNRCPGTGGWYGKDEFGRDYWMTCGGCGGSGRIPGMYPWSNWATETEKRYHRPHRCCKDE